MKILTGILLTLFICFGCHKKKTSYDILFDKYDSTFSRSEKETIKKCGSISCLSDFIRQDTSRRFTIVFNTFSDSIKISLWDSVKNCGLLGNRLAFLYAYQKKLNNENLSFTQITKELKHFGDSLDAYYTNEIKKDSQIKADLAKCNYDKFKKGDTLNLLFPLEKNSYNKTVVFYSHYDKTNFKDTLFLRCILAKKNIEVSKGIGWEITQYYFSMKILKLENKEMNLVDNDYKKGEIINLDLSIYNRPIL